MLNNNDPRQFRDMSDNPTNTGWEDRDWDEIRPMFFIDEFEPEQEDEEDYPRNTYKENIFLNTSDGFS